ncbi:MAG TPA: cell wall-active antibiotics response protein [Clostridiaceae bacterium]|nr:cell wall-active antibiotics response protein [Clostridiaceae bacterium]
MKNQYIGRIIWGIALVAVGTIFALNALGITQISIFFDGWWTLFIIVPSFVCLFTRRGKMGCLIGLVVGVSLLLSAQGIISFATVWKLAIPIIIILIGLRLIFTSPFQRQTNKIIRGLKRDNEAPVKETAAFSAQKICFDGQVFNGAVLDAVFGSISCDLRNAIIEKDCLISASAVFAGIEIKVPDHVHVEIASDSLFGGVSDKKKSTKEQGGQSNKTITLFIEAHCVFGGVDIT